MDGLKIQTGTNKSYYIKYRTHNAGQSNFYPEVTSIENDYAGSAGKPIQKLGIRVYSNAGVKLTAGVVVMYRAYVNGVWMPWVSNADPEWMQLVQVKYNLGGTLNTSGYYTGVEGQNISGIEIRVFEETSLDYNQTPTGDYKIIQAPFIYQMDKYPTGCESVAAVMALQYAGINISVDTFIDKYLDRSSGIPFDPNSTFGGNPRSTSGFGCYAPVIKKALDKVLASTKYKATQLSNANEYELGAEKTFSFQAVLPKADLQQYVLKIGGENGLLYQRVLDGSEIPDTPDTTTSASSTVPTTGSDAQETSGSSVTSGTSAGTQPSGTDPDTGVPSSPSAPDGSGDSAQTGDTYPIVWGVAAVAALLVLGTVVILKKKEENRHA